MILIIGGCAQGKHEYARSKYENADAHILNLNSWASGIFEKDEDALTLLKKAAENDPNLIVITREVGNGIVPVDAKAREFRTRIGRLQCEVAAIADEVIRVCCGVGQKIK